MVRIQVGPLLFPLISCYYGVAMAQQSAQSSSDSLPQKYFHGVYKGQKISAHEYQKIAQERVVAMEKAFQEYQKKMDQILDHANKITKKFVEQVDEARIKNARKKGGLTNE